MTIVNQLTLRHLKQNKGRTVITTLGICVSVAMITAVFVAVASFMNFIGALAVMNCGEEHFTAENLSAETVAELKNDGRIDMVGLCLPSENCFEFKLAKMKSEKVGTGSLLVGDETYLAQMATGSYDGKLPTDENQIAIEEKTLKQNGYNLKIGDTIEMEESYYSAENEENVSCGFKKYKITAILHDNPSTDYLPVWRGMSAAEKNGTVSAAVLLKDPNFNSLKVIDALTKEYKLKDIVTNKDYLESKLAISKDGVVASSLMPISIVMLVIIIAASVTLIYNAFGMSLSERVRYLGMLSSVGATKRQKRQSVYFEGLILGIVGIPVGIGAGIAGIAVTLSAVAEKLISTGVFADTAGADIDFKTVVPLWAILSIVIVSAFTIFISVLIPAKKASAITPIEAIRQSGEVKLKSKKLKTPKYIGKIFGYEGELAHKNLKRNGRKSRVITASIALSIVLFLSCNYFCNIFTQAIGVESDVPYQVYATVSYGDRQKLTDALSRMENVKDFYTVNCTNGILSDKHDFFKTNLTDKKFLTTAYSNVFRGDGISVYINTVDDEAFNKLCKDNNIDYTKLYGDELCGVVMNNITHKSGGAKVFNNSAIGQKIEKKFDDPAIKLTVAGFADYDADDYLCRLNPQGVISVYVPISQQKKITFNSTDDFLWKVGIVTDEHEKVCEAVEETLESGDYSSNLVQDYVDALEQMSTISFVLQVFVYGFIVLISLITVANIINTISTNISLRRKEFAMLKSVGTTPNGFNKMVSLESAFYAIKSLLFGLPVSLAVSVIMNKLLGQNTIPFIFDWKMYIAVIAVVSVIIGFTMLYSVGKLKDDNIAETLKEDIT